uniref:hypothetical protein n=1 Tax=uncultured Nostoc sp. TaxID=340711 RepID=UPI0035CB1532
MSTTVLSLPKDSEVVGVQTSKQKGVARTEPQRMALEVARDKSTTLDELLPAQKCTVQGCRQGPYCLDLANTHHIISRQDIESSIISSSLSDGPRPGMPS